MCWGCFRRVLGMFNICVVRIWCTFDERWVCVLMCMFRVSFRVCQRYVLCVECVVGVCWVYLSVCVTAGVAYTVEPSTSNHTKGSQYYD